MPESLPPIAVAITGASGAQYGLRLLDCLVEQDRGVYLVVSQAGQVVLRMETELEVPNRPQEAERFFTEYFGAEPGQIRVFGRQEWTAPVASGSNPPDVMVVIPCSMGTMGRIAHGYSEDVLLRAADVVLKEKKKLILVPRETPLSLVHVRNFELLLLAGATSLPANPAFTPGPKPPSNSPIPSWRVCWIISAFRTRLRRAGRRKGSNTRAQV